MACPRRETPKDERVVPGGRPRRMSGWFQAGRQRVQGTGPAGARVSVSQTIGKAVFRWTIMMCKISLLYVHNHYPGTVATSLKSWTAVSFSTLMFWQVELRRLAGS